MTGTTFSGDARRCRPPARVGEGKDDAAADPVDRPSHLERREIRRTYRLWRRHGADRLDPALRKFGLGPASSGSEHRFLVVEDPVPGRSVFVHCGASAMRAFGAEVIGRMLADVLPPEAPQLLRACAKALRQRRPVEAHGGYRRMDGAILVYRAIFLPMGGEYATVRFILGAFGCRDVRLDPAIPSPRRHDAREEID